MKQEELEDLEDYASKTDENRHRIFKKYLKTYKETIDTKKPECRWGMTESELDSNAVLAVNAMFKEAEEILYKGFDLVEKSISMPALFKKYLDKFIRENKADNRPFSSSIKSSFKKTVAKTIKKNIYSGYDISCPIIPDSSLIEYNYIGSQENEDKERIQELISIVAPDPKSQIFNDLSDRYIDGKTMREIAEEPRNEGVSKQAISRRMKRYVDKVSVEAKKVDEEEDGSLE